MAQSILSYRVSLTGSQWEWVIQSRGKIIRRGSASNCIKARAEAMVAAMSYVDRSAKTPSVSANSATRTTATRKSTVKTTTPSSSTTEM
jgi:hypothetical protein